MISIRLEDPDGARAPAGACRASTSRCASGPTDEQRSVLRNYSLSGPPGAGYYRDQRQARADGAASGYLHTRLAVGDELDVAAPRGTFILDPTRRAGAADQRRHRRDARSWPCCTRWRTEQSEREVWWLHGARSGATTPSPPRRATLLASLPNVRAHVCYSRPGSGRPRRPRLRPRGPAHRVAARRARPAARRRGLPVRPGAVHGRDQRRPGGARPRRLAHPHRAVRARARPDARASRRRPRGRRTRRPASPAAARRSSSRAATSPSRGAATTRACSSSPRPATCPCAGRAAPASATPARRR